MVRKSYLNRIISIDSLAKGKMTELKVHQHANLSGGNGAGKTTWLRTVPFFYGASPSHISPVDNNNNKFVNHYLPKPTSLIIYEYQNSHGMNCAVVYRHSSGEKPAYRFVAEPFNEEFFTDMRDGERFFLAAKDLVSHWTKLKLRYSKQIESVSDYKAIILGDRDLIRKSADRRELTSLSNMYGLSSQVGLLKHIDKITMATLNRTADFNAFSTMLGSIMVDEGISAPSAINFGDIYETINAVPVIQELDSNLSLFKGVVQKGITFLDNSRELNAVGEELAAIKIKLTDGIATLSSEISKIEAEIDEDAATWREQELTLNSQILIAQSQLGQADRELDTLNSKHEAWSNQQIEDKKAQFANIDIELKKLEVEKNYLGALEEVVQDIKAQFDELKSHEKNRHNESLVALGEKIESFQNELRAEVSHYQIKKDNISRAKDAEIAEKTEIGTQQISAMAGKIGEARQLSINTIYTEEESANLAMSEAALDNARQQYDEAISKRDSIEGQLRLLKLAMDNKHDAWRTVVKEETEQQNIIASKVALFQPKAGTLLYDLKNTDGFSLDSISKFIRPELLDRKDLLPAYLSDSSQNTILGWTFDLSKIEKPSWALGIDEQKAELEMLEKELDTITRHAQDLQAAYNKSQKEFNAADDERTKIIQLCQSLDNKVNSSKEAVKTERAKNEQMALGRKADAKKRLNDLLREQGALKELQRDIIESISDRFRENFNELLSAHGYETSRIEDLIEQHKQLREDEKKNHKEKLIAIEKDYLAKCAEQNVDDAKLRKHKEDVLALDLRIKTIKGYEEIIDRYNTFLTYEWVDREKFRQNLEDARKAKYDADAELEKQKKEFSNTRGIKLAQASDKKRSLTNANRELQDCKSAAMKIGAAFATPSTKNDLRTVEIAIAEANHLYEFQNQLRKEIDIGIKQANAIIFKSGVENQIASVWANFCKDHQDLSSPESTNINLTQSLKSLIDDYLPQQRTAVVSYIDNAGASISNFYTALSHISDAISAQSRTISSIISEKNFFPDIANVSISLTSKVNAQEYWPALNEFQKMWREWRELNRDGLPPKEVIDQLLTTYRILQKYQPDSKIESLFELKVNAVQNGQAVNASNGAQFNRLSSTGLSSLILYTLLGGLTTLLNRDENVMITWPVDELMTISPENTTRLFSMLDYKRIVMLGGFPSSDVNALRNFKEHHEVKSNGNIVKIVVPEDKLTQLINERKKRHQPEGAEV